MARMMGMMGGGWSQPPSGQMPIDQDEALLIAQEFLGSSHGGTIADDNGYDRTVWFHN